jgi:hypothetical protein
VGFSSLIKYTTIEKERGSKPPLPFLEAEILVRKVGGFQVGYKYTTIEK